MVSARLEARLVVELRRLAEETGVSLSELLRRGVEMVLADARSNPARLTWEVRGAPANATPPAEHATIEGGAELISVGTGSILPGSHSG